MSKSRIILIYGIIAGVIVVAGMQVAMFAGVEGGTLGMAIGYLNMLIALSMIFIGIKRYRDEVQGGVIRFGTALMLGAGIAAIGCLGYVVGWEAYLAVNGYDFMERYAASTLEGMAADGASAADIEAARVMMQDYVEAYRNPLLRMGLTLTEIAPVALLVTLLSAALLRNPRVLPAKG